MIVMLMIMQRWYLGNVGQQTHDESETSEVVGLRNLRCVDASYSTSNRCEVLAGGIRYDALPGSRRSGRLDDPCHAVVLYEIQRIIQFSIKMMIMMMVTMMITIMVIIMMAMMITIMHTYVMTTIWAVIKKHAGTHTQPRRAMIAKNSQLAIFCRHSNIYIYI